MADRFDWNQWLMTIPGIPADWPGAPLPQAATSEDAAPEDDYRMELPKAA